MSGVTGVDVEHTKALEAAATPGPWVARPSPMGAMLPDEVFASGESFGRNVPAECHQREDAEFIAHARTALPALVAAVERVQALHTPVSLIVDGKPYGTLCRECTDIDIVNAWECDDGDPDDGYIEHPCNTIRALETPK
ncbi:hypothetical protein [Rhodococcus erythropolis]|uniref:hypothetical protein n=1 Tax=Rhodococcus erythropolis TaxID=1833 RepID=UPI0022272809|nr:hypothetical protein [Rhodococcus erythropolis]MCW2300711.1 hypothetical protein [Rhodococcus erythropolis]